MARNTLLVRTLMDGGMSERRAEAFERWLDDYRPLGISSVTVEGCLIRHEANNIARFDNLMEQHLALCEKAYSAGQPKQGEIEWSRN
jgi:hypothetical protein